MAITLLIAAPASGQGKTTVAAALARLHARQGRRVCCFKCGPDFLDPMWLEAASGRPVDSLDLWINGPDDCARRLAAASREADLVVIEGVMGLFDGDPSAADLAQRFDIPVVAVIDAGAMAGTFAALAHGLRHWRPALPWAGVFANRVGSARHADMLRDALDPAREDDGGPWLGHLARNDAIVLPERHLGLTMPAEGGDTLARLDAAADALANQPLGRDLAEWPRWPLRGVCDANAETLSQTLADSTARTGTHHRPLAGRRVAVARDAAFAFIYPANLETMRDLGAQLLFFSPLAGDPLPVCDAVWLPGGYPELHAARLSELVGLRAQIAAHVQAGKPLWAECGGLMALAERLVDAAGRSHALWGLLPGTAVMGRRLAALGPHALAIESGTPEDVPPLRGHSFHWSRFETPLGPAASTTPQRRSTAAGEGEGEAVYEQGSLRASWFHPWFPSSPAAAARLFDHRPVFAAPGSPSRP
ncbi:cobyrinate a,c-diamide synthase [Piscinibacter koreensis]|uniref:Cobyrinate a,c-diamide synthase n=1 Tax=Piscinibacter koreensis TaxID=2742824 RepID=A0A7Y6TXT5_9BURK|nr:cobyrinate a,c-diamide synthase [Schlegelella koreensis]NUZ07386.1 cobyrinate a,c-diamide synthase [Schlegelella koreensis]